MKCKEHYFSTFLSPFEDFKGLNIPRVSQGIRSTLLSSLAGELLVGLGSEGSSKLRMNMMTRPSSFFTGTTSIAQWKHTPAETHTHTHSHVILKHSTRWRHQTENDCCS